MSRLPIRLRLALAFAVAMAAVLAAVGTFLYVRLGATLDERIADGLESRAAALATVLRDGDVTEVDPEIVAGEEGVVQILDRDGSVVVGSGAYGDAPVVSQQDLAAASRRAVMLEKELAIGSSTDEEVRLRVELVGDFVTVVGESLDDRDDALDLLLAQLLVILPIAVLVSAGIGYAVAGAALRPVESMRAEAAAISGAEPERRLPLPSSRDEIRRLGVTLNEMLDRLALALERERTFVADASHELRTPLALLAAELELALRQPRTAEELELAVRSAAEETDRLVHLAEDLLLVARADRGKLPIHATRVDVDELFAGLAARFERRARSADREIRPARADGIAVAADPTRLGQALGNLVDNALRHGAGTIRLVAEESDARVELHVTDEGAGFPPGFLPRAFERFTRYDEARARGGTGLGLAIVDAIARAHGGSAHAANREGGGVDVWLSLPRRSKDDDAARRDRASSRPT